jgi:pectinesterase
MDRIIVDRNTEVNTIAKALQLAEGSGCHDIFVRKGIYEEKVKVTLSDLLITGEDKDNTIITYRDYAKKIHEDGKEYNTFRTYTFMVLANNVTLEHLTIRNDSGPGSVVGQAVALSVTGDMVKIDDCHLVAHQDTLFLGPLPKDLIIRYEGFQKDDELIAPKQHRVLITDSMIAGDVDFVFGCANACFLNCVFVSHPGNGYVFAPATEEDDFYGFTALHCRFIGDRNIRRVYLARPWRDFGKLVLIDCLMDNHIMEEGFNHWEGTRREATCRFYEKGTRYTDGHQFQRVPYVKELAEEELKRYNPENILR